MSETTFSLGEAETLCVLYALSAGPCAPSELAARLGLHPAHGPAAAEVAIGPFANHATSADGLVALTDDGRAHLKSRLKAVLGEVPARVR